MLYYGTLLIWRIRKLHTKSHTPRKQHVRKYESTMLLHCTREFSNPSLSAFVKCPRCVKIKHLGHFSYVLNWKKFPISEEFFRILKYFSSQSHTRAHECTRKSAKTLHTTRCIMALTHSIKSSVNASISWHSPWEFRGIQYPLSFFFAFPFF